MSLVWSLNFQWTCWAFGVLVLCQFYFGSKAALHMSASTLWQNQVVAHHSTVALLILVARQSRIFYLQKIKLQMTHKVLPPMNPASDNK